MAKTDLVELQWRVPSRSDLLLPVEWSFLAAGKAFHGTDRQRHFRGRYGDSSSRLADVAFD